MFNDSGMKTVADFGSYEMVDAVVLRVLASDPDGFFINVDGRDRTFFSPQFAAARERMPEPVPTSKILSAEKP